MKRIFSLLIALILVATFAPVSAIEANALTMDENYTQYKIVFDPGAAPGSSAPSGYQAKEVSVILPSAKSIGYSYDGYTFTGWNISGRTYGAGDTYTFSTSTASKNSDNQYTVYATAKWSKDGSSSSSGSSSGSGSSSSSSSSTSKITITYSPGDATGSYIPRSYNKGEEFSLASNPYTYKGYSFKGWLITGYESYGILAPGQKVTVNENITAVAQWQKSNTGITIIDPNNPDGSSSSSSSSGVTSSQPSSSQASSSKPASSKPASSKPTSSKPASSSSSSSSLASTSSSSSMSESSSSSSSVVETPVVDTFEPISLAYSINGDIPVTGIEFLLKEDIGENPQLVVAALDTYSVIDAAALGFIESGEALAAFDLSLLSAGLSYNGKAPGTVTYTLNGTQATASSNYDGYVLAMVHTTSAAGYEGDYYMTDGENTYTYTPSTAFKSAVTNVKLVEEDGYYRLVIRDVAGLSKFAYLADANTIVEVALVPNAAAASASIDVTSLSPILLAHIEVGEGKTSAGIPFWVWIIVAVVVLLVAVLVVLFLINRKNEQRRYEERSERHSSHRSSYSSGITGFDDEE